MRKLLASSGAIPESHPARPNKQMWHSIMDDGKLLLVDGRIIMPDGARKYILRKLHTSHAGKVKTSRQLYFWPAMTAAIEQMIDACGKCQEKRPVQQKQPLTLATPYADLYPMDEIDMDLFELRGKHYLCAVDRYSGHPFVWLLHRLDTAAVLKATEDLFFLFGKCCVVRTDRGPQFRSQFGEFCKRHNIVHETSSAYYARSNGLSEAAVKVCKSLLGKCEGRWQDFKPALMAYRNTARADGFSPAQMFLFRRLRNELADVQVEAGRDGGLPRGGRGTPGLLRQG